MYQEAASYRTPDTDNYHGKRLDSKKEKLVDEVGPAIWSATEEQQTAMTKKIEAEMKKNADAFVEQRLQLDGDQATLWNTLVEEMKELSTETLESRKEGASDEKVLKQNLTRSRLQLEALAKIRTKLSVVNRPRTESDSKKVLGSITHEKETTSEIMTSELPQDIKVERAADFILNRAEERLAKELVKNPDLIGELKTEMDVLINTGGMSAETEFTPEPKKSTAPKKETTKRELKLENIRKRIVGVQTQLKSLSWFEKTFKAKGLKDSLKKLMTQEDQLKQEVAGVRIVDALSSGNLDQTVPEPNIAEFPEANVETLENPWQIYQAELASLQSIQNKLSALGKWPWQDRAQKIEIKG